MSLIAVPPWGRYRISTQLQWPRKLVVRIHFRWLKGKRDGHKSTAHKFKPLSFLIESQSQACNLIADLPFLLLSMGLKAGLFGKRQDGFETFLSIHPSVFSTIQLSQRYQFSCVLQGQTIKNCTLQIQSTLQT